jgi:phthalate 4,5-dioxygenase oxygenase subunit
MALSREDNELLTRVGPGSPMGELMRRFWVPVLLASELAEPDCDPVRVKCMGIYHVAFRDSAGRLGLLDARCPHRGADLSFGYNEEGGLRCARCLWKFDVDGNLLDLPMEPADSPLWKVKAPSFGIREYGGLIWGYLGPQDETPELPEFEWTRVAPGQRHLSRFAVECNYLQGMEGGLDAARLEALAQAGLYTGDPTDLDETTHRVEAVQTDYGLAIGTTTQDGADAAGLAVTQWLMPFYTTLPADRGGVLEALAWVPLDDEATMAFAITYNPKRPLSKKVLADIRAGRRVHQRLAEGTVRRERNPSNGYLGEGKKGSAAVAPFFQRFATTLEMAIACQESMGAIVDRSREQLTENDAAVEGARRVLKEAAVDLMEGTVPVIVSKGEAYRVRSYKGVAREGVAFHEDEAVRRGTAAEV